MNILLGLRVGIWMGIGISVLANTLEKSSLPLELRLEEAVQLALQYNPTLGVQKGQLAEQRGVLREIKGAMHPRLISSGSYNKIDEEKLQSFGSGQMPEDQRYDASIEGSMTVFSGGRNRDAINGQKALTQASEMNIQTVLQDLIVAIHESFSLAQLAEVNIKVQLENLEVLNEQLQIAKNRFQSGVGARFDVMQAEVSASNAKPPLIRAQNDYRRAVENLRHGIGLPYPKGLDARDIKLIRDAFKKFPEQNLDQTLKTAWQNRTEIKAIEAQLVSAQNQINVIQKEHMPVVDLYADYGAENDPFGKDDILKGWTAGARVNWTLSDGARNKGKVDQAMARMLQIQKQRDEWILLIEKEVREAYFDFEEAQSILETTSLVIEQSEEALRLAKNRYQAGRGTQLDVLESQLTRTRSKLEHENASHDLKMAVIRIKRAMGQNLLP